MTDLPAPSPSYLQYPDTESISNYCKGGYHPVRIGDILQSRYCVINKLGHGSYGTVWLVEDLSLKRFVSLKVLVASVTDASSEIDIVRHLRIQQQKIPPIAGADYVVNGFDDFTIDGPNGTHRCIVTELLGPSLGCHEIEDIYDDGPLPFAFTKKIAAQIARGVAFLHKSGVVHGDLHLGNILLHDPRMESWPLQVLEDYFGKPCMFPLIREDGVPITTRSPSLPEYLVASPKPLPLLEFCLASSDSVHVKICDFGEAFLTSTTNTKIELKTPVVYAAPEIIFPEPSTPVGPPTDIWALAVLLHMILSSNSTLFCSAHGIEKEVVREMVLTLGKLPERWWIRWSDRAEYFREDGTFIGDKKKLPRASGKFQKLDRSAMGEEDFEVFESLLRKMVRYDIRDRISADEVVQLIPENWMSGM